jgi:hypothetical protein
MVLITILLLGSLTLFGGCQMAGYSQQSLYPADIETVCVKMFDNRSFRRGVEYDFTDALAKRIEAETPYKVISKASQADTVISGYFSSISEGILTTERETGRALEREVRLTAVVSWKNIRTGKLILDSEMITAVSSYSQWQNQSFNYASSLASNKLADKVVQRMELDW